MQKKRIIIVVIVGLLLIAAIFTLINWKDLSEKGVGGFFYDLFHTDEVLALQATEIDAENREISGFGAYKDTIVYAGKQGISGMNLKGEWLWDETSASFLNPYIKNSGEYTVVAELDGKKVFLFRKNVLVWQTEFQGTIISADVNAKGYVAVAHELENYNGAITVLTPEAQADKSGKVLFVNKISTETVISAILSPDSGQMMISSISTENEVMTGSIRFVNLDDGKTYASLQTENEVYPLSWYVNDETVIAANNGSICKLTRKKSASTELDSNTELWTGENAGQDIYSVCVVDNTYIVVASGSDSQGVYSQNAESKITVMNLDGEVVNTFTVPHTVTRLDAGDGIFAVGTVNAVSFYQTDGVKLYDYETVSEIEKTLIIDKKNFLVVTKKTAYILSAKPLSDDAQ